MSSDPQKKNESAGSNGSGDGKPRPAQPSLGAGKPAGPAGERKLAGSGRSGPGGVGPRGPARPPGFPRSPNTLTIFILLFLLLISALYLLTQGMGAVREIDYTEFKQEVDQKNVKEVVIQGAIVQGTLIEPPDDPSATPADIKANGGKPIKLNPRFRVTLPPAAATDPELLKQLAEASATADAKTKIVAKEPEDSSGTILLMYVLTAALMIGVIVFLYRRAQSQLGGGGILGSFGKSPARRYEASKSRVTFADVAGLENVKQDLQEIVEFLKNPEKFQRLGGRIPKGTLLVGPPGTGKTLLARAVAGEAGVPFYSINGSEFIQMFVGVGASRVRDLFKTAKEHSPCILFIDEIDAVGRIRGAGLGGGHDEREQTLNQILSEMDGFEPHDSLIVIAASNRPDVLDPALLRPGRFDRHITVDRPRLKGREEQFRVHTRDVPVAADVDFDRLARGTIGMTGADIRNLVNEAALWAARMGRDKVTMEDFEFARDKVLMGPKRDEVLSPHEKEMTAFHEAGHALLAWLLPGVDRLHKVAIVPRGMALGVTQILPQEDRLNISEKELHSRLAFIMGGRAAEKLIYDEFSAGAEDDLKKATRLARRMVTAWGMSPRLGPVNFQTADEHPFLGKEFHEQRQFSEHTANIVDEEVSRILNGAADHAQAVLTENRDKLEALARALEEKEELDEVEIAGLIGPSRYYPAGNGQKADSDSSRAEA